MAAGYVLCSLPTSVCHAQVVPNLINYQGRLTDQTGAGLPAAIYQIQFRLWDSPTSTGTSSFIWGQQVNVTVQSNGIFAVMLGSGGTPIANPTPAVNDLSFAFGQPNRYMGITVVTSNGSAITGASEILPRQQILSTPFALVAQQAAAAQQASALVGSITNSLCPPGSIMAFAGDFNHIPSGWILCDGSAVSRTAFSSLFSAIGNAYGSGDGANTFNLPDFRGMFLRGVDGNAGRDPDDATRTASAAGGNVGNAVGSVQSGQIQSHAHPYKAWTQQSGSNVGVYGPYTGNDPSSTMIMYTNMPTGGNETRPINAYVNFIVKY